MLADADTARLRGLCEATLRQNWREGLRATDRMPFAYTCPSPGHYPWQWYWDSCFTAIAWRRVDPSERASNWSRCWRRRRRRLHRPHDLLEHAAVRPRRYTYNVVPPDAR